MSMAQPIVNNPTEVSDVINQGRGQRNAPVSQDEIGAHQQNNMRDQMMQQAAVAMRQNYAGRGQPMFNRDQMDGFTGLLGGGAMHDRGTIEPTNLDEGNNMPIVMEEMINNMSGLPFGMNNQKIEEMKGTIPQLQPEMKGATTYRFYEPAENNPMKASLFIGLQRNRTNNWLAFV